MTIAGFVNGNKGVPTKIAFPVGLQIFGPIAPKMIQEIKPVAVAAIAPVDVKFFQ